MSVYVVDTNFFIQAHRFYYPLDVVPSFWSKVKQLADAGKIVSLDKVKNEIYNNEDDLKRWCVSNLPNDFFKDSTEVVTDYAQVAAWAYSRRTQYTSAAIAEFLAADEADAWLVAYGLASPAQRVIVTYEKSDLNIKRKIKIPEACNHFGLRFLDTVSMLRELKESI